MRTYEETYERILSKKAIAEKELKARNKRIITSVTAVSCLGICLVALFAISKARISVNLNKNDVPDVCLNSSSTNSNTDKNTNNTSTISTTLTETPNIQTSAKTNEDTIKPSVGEKDDTTTVNLPTGQNNSTTLFEPQVITTNVHGGEELPDWKKEEIERHRISMVRSAMRAVAEEEVEKIDIDKSFIISMYGKPGIEEQGKEYYLMHLEGDDFYYEVEIDAAGEKIYNLKRIDK